MPPLPVASSGRRLALEKAITRAETRRARYRQILEVPVMLGHDPDFARLMLQLIENELAELRAARARLLVDEPR